METLELLCFELGDPAGQHGIFPVNVKPTDKVLNLRLAICNMIKAEDLRKLRLWKASFPINSEFDKKVGDISESMDDAAVLTPLSTISTIFPSPLLTDCVHIFVKVLSDSDPSGEVVSMLKQNHARLFACLKVAVARWHDWTKQDIESNNGRFLENNNEEIPPEIKDLEIRLCKQRVFSNTKDPYLTLAQRQLSFPSSYVCRTTRRSDPEAMVKTDLEFLMFLNLLSCYIPDAPRFKKGPASSMKATAVKSNFIYPPFFSGASSTNELVYTEELAWQFPMFIECHAMADLPLKYCPRNDFCVWFERERGSVALPLVIGEIISQLNEKDRFRMLLQAIALARLVSELRKSKSKIQPFIVAIYLTGDMVAERYIVMKEGATSDKVFIRCRNFNLAEANGAINFQREMYNLASILKSIVGELDVKRSVDLAALKQDASGMKSLHSARKTHQTDGKGGPMDTIPEEGQGSGPQGGVSQGRDLGVFSDNVIHAALDKFNCEVEDIACGFPHIAPILERTTRDLIGCLKFVEDGAKEREIENLQYLAALPSEHNHTVRPFGIWSVTGGSIIAMQAAGGHLTSLDDLNTHLWSLMRQLFEAVEFMHNHNVAHLDLKPGNILVPKTYGRLTIIDFGSSVRLRHKRQLLQGYVGTQGYMAPEVGRTKFSPIRADLWSVGQVVKELCMLCPTSAYHAWLSDLSKRLLNNNPSKRPLMSEVLEQMSKRDASEEGRALTARRARLRLLPALPMIAT